MGPIDLFLHAANFLAPAFFLALLLPLASRLLMRRGAGGRLWLQMVLVFAAGAAVLAAGLWYFGRDGKMATYAALAVAAATMQWLAARAWK